MRKLNGFQENLSILASDVCRYDLLSRPVNLFPLEREVINTEFLLVTRYSPGQIKWPAFFMKRQFEQDPSYLCREKV